MAEEIAQTGAAVVDKWAERLSNVMAQYGPDAANFAVEVGRIGAIQAVATGIVCLGVALGIASFSKVVLRKAVAVRQARVKDFDDAHIPVFIAFGVLCAATAVFGIAALKNLTNFYAWAGMFRPEVYLAARALGL